MSGAFKCFHTKVVGVTAKNDDGTSRQDILSDCSVGEELYLERDQYDEHDANAIEVLTTDYQTLGYLKRKVAADMAPLMDAGVEFTCRISELTGGTEDKETLGCNIRIEGRTPSADADSAMKEIAVTIAHTKFEYQKKPSEMSAPKKVGLIGCIGALLKLTVLVFAALIVIIVIISIIKER